MINTIAAAGPAISRCRGTTSQRSCEEVEPPAAMFCAICAIGQPCAVCQMRFGASQQQGDRRREPRTCASEHRAISDDQDRDGATGQDECREDLDLHRQSGGDAESKPGR